MRVKAEVVALDRLSVLKQRLRRADERRLAAGASAEQIARENAFISPDLARRARIKSIGRRFSVEDFDF